MINKKGIEKINFRVNRFQSIVENSSSVSELVSAKSVLVGINYAIVVMFTHEFEEIWEVSDRIQNMIQFINERISDLSLKENDMIGKEDDDSRR